MAQMMNTFFGHLRLRHPRVTVRPSGFRRWTSPSRRTRSSCRSTCSGCRRTRSRSSSTRTSSPSAASAGAKSDVKQDDYFRFERRVVAFSRGVSLPAGVKDDQIDASYENGVLEIRVPQARAVQAEAHPDRRRLVPRDRGHRHPQGRLGSKSKPTAAGAGSSGLSGRPGRRLVLVVRASARRRSACRGGTARRGTGSGRVRRRARTGRRRTRRCPLARSSRRSRSRPRRLPNRDGLMFTILGGNGSASMSATEWIGASQVIRSRCGSSTGVGLRRQRRVLDPRVREAPRRRSR